jgi:hypothetical protein
MVDDFVYNVGLAPSDHPGDYMGHYFPVIVLKKWPFEQRTGMALVLLGPSCYFLRILVPGFTWKEFVAYSFSGPS